MDQSAIQLIQQTAIAANNGRQERMPPGTIALPDNFKIHDLEQFQDTRKRFRGVLKTASLADFVGYTKANGNSTDGIETGRVGVEGFIDADNLSSTIIFNLYDEEMNPGHCDWRAVLNLKQTAAYKALLGVESKHLTQRDLIDWMEDWHSNIVGIVNESGASVGIGAAITAIRKLEIKSRRESTHTDETRRAARTALEEVEAKAGESLPDRLEFTCEPYLGLPSRTFGLRLSVLTSHDDPRLTIRIGSKEEQAEAIAKDFKELLLREIGESAKLTIGTFTP